jgi:hypothetical protein
MDCTRFLVRPGHNEGWLIEDGRRDMGPYHSRDLALQVAVSECLALRRAGLPARVTVEDGKGQPIVKRCLCASFGR